MIKADAVCRTDVPVHTEWRGPRRLRFPNEMQFPPPLANRLEVDAKVIVERLVRVRLAKLSMEKMPDIFAINHTIGWRFCTRQCSEGRKKIERARKFFARCAFWYPLGPPENGRHAHTTFKRRNLSAAQRARGTTMIGREMAIGVLLVLDQPRAVVTGEQNVGFLGDAHLSNGVQNAPDVEVDLFNHVAVQPTLAFAFELCRCCESGMRHRVGNVNEERAILVLLHEPDGFVRVAFGQRRHVRFRLDQFFIAVQIGDAIVAGGRAEEIVEALSRWKRSMKKAFWLCLARSHLPKQAVA